MKEYVLGFCFLPDGACVLMERTKRDWQYGLINGLGGKVEDSESPFDAMIREFEEESGVRTRYDQWRHVITVDYAPMWKIYVFKGRVNTYEFKQSCEEGVINLFYNCPVNMEQTARWLYYLCLDESTEGAKKYNTVPVL